MPNYSGSTENQLIAYWKSAAKLNLINQRIFPREELICARFIPTAQIEKGLLDSWVGEQQEIYLAPFCFKKGADCSVPFWLEITLFPTGEIKPNPQGALLWVLPAFLDSLSPQLPILGSVHDHDALLSDYFGSPDDPTVFENFTEYYETCLRFMSELRPNWKQEFIQTGFELLDSAILLPITAMPTLALAANPLTHENRALDVYTQVDFAPTKSIENILTPILKQGLLPRECSSETQAALLALAGLEVGDCLGIEQDKNFGHADFFIAFIEYLYIERALAKQSLPSMLFLAAVQKQDDLFTLPEHFAFSSQQLTQTVESLIEVFNQLFSEDQFTGLTLTPEYMIAYLHESLDFTYKQYQHGLSLLHLYQDRLALNLEAKILDLQKQDEILEQRYQSLLAAQADLSHGTPKSFIGQIWQKLAQNPSKNQTKNLEKLAQHLVLDDTEEALIKNSKNMLEWVSDNLRKIQVERTKLTAELIHLSEALVDKQSQWQKLLAWQKKHQLTIFLDEFSISDDLDFSLEVKIHFGKRLFKLANLYWKIQQQSGQLFNHEVIYQDPHKKWCKSYSAPVDYLFVFQANQFSPMLGAEFAASAKRLIGFTGMKTLPTPILTPLQDSWLAHRNKLTQHFSESLLEEVGVFVSTGDAFELIKTHSVYEDPGYPGAGFTQAFYLKSKEDNTNQSILQVKIDFQPIVGEMVPDRGSYVNILEAQHVLHWLSKQESPLLEEVMIITVFAAQKAYLSSLFEDKLDFPVYTLREAIGKRAKYVVVSMVKTSQSIGPSIYDQNPLLLPEINQLAEEKLIIFADPSIFSLSHTTLGKFAHKILARKSEKPDQKKDILFA